MMGTSQRRNTGRISLRNSSGVSPQLSPAPTFDMQTSRRTPCFSIAATIPRVASETSVLGLPSPLPPTQSAWITAS